MLIQEIIQAIHPLQVIAQDDSLQCFDIRHLLTDSRRLGNEPEATLFFALKTEKNDGAKYIPQLIERGVHAFVLTQEQYDSLPITYSPSGRPIGGTPSYSAASYSQQKETLHAGVSFVYYMFLFICVRHNIIFIYRFLYGIPIHAF